MFDPNEPKTLPEQIRMLLLVLSLQLIVCGLVNAVGLRFAAAFDRTLVVNLLLFGAGSVTFGFLLMNVMAVTACVLVLRDERELEVRPLARVALPLNAGASCLLLIMFLFGDWTLNAAVAGGALATMFLALVLPARKKDRPTAKEQDPSGLAGGIFFVRVSSTPGRHGPCRGRRAMPPAARRCRSPGAAP